MAFVRDERVGVETSRNGSSDADCDVDDLLFERETEALKERGDDVRSSKIGGGMPSSVCSQSICTNVADSWLSRFVWKSMHVLSSWI